MIENLLYRIADSRELFIHRCRERMQNRGYGDIIPAKLEDLQKAFNGLLNILQKFATEKPAQQIHFSGDLDPHGRSIVEQTRQYHGMGLSMEMSMGFFKIVVQTLEDCIAELELPDDQTTIALLNLRRVADILETAIIEQWECSGKTGSMKELETAHRRLLLEKSTYENIYRGTNNIILVTNRDGYIIDANPPAEEFFSRGNILGRFCGDLLGVSSASVKDVLEVFPLGQTHEITLSHDGMDEVFDLRILPRESDIAESSGILLLFNDITRLVNDRLKLERRVSERTRDQANAEKMRGVIFQSVGEGILLVDQEFEVINANRRAAEIYGIPLQNLIGSDMRMLTDPPGWNHLNGFFDELLEGQRLHMEITGIYVDGRTFPTDTTVTRIDYDNKKFWTIIVHDISEHKQMEKSIREKKRQTEEMNLTLKNVLNTIEKDRKDFENRLTARIKTSILPGLERVEKETDASARKSYLNLLGQQLVALTSGFDTKLDAGMLKLTKTELEVCRLIQAGCASKEICEVMNLSFETILTHRKNIRRKLNLRGSKVNLQAFLSSRIVENTGSTNNQG